VRPGYKQTEVGVIPDDWDVPFLRQHLQHDATYGVVKAGTFQRTGIPMLRSGDIKNGLIAEDQPLISGAKNREYSRTVLKEQDVVIALVGYPGETAVVPKRLAGANISRAVGLLRPAQTLLPGFLACYLNSPEGRKEFLRPSAGSAQIVVNLSALNRLRFPLPSLPEQHAIATALSDVDALLEALDRLIAKKRALEQAAMQRLLSGETRLDGPSVEWSELPFGDIAAIRNAKVIAASTPLGTQCIELESIDQGTGRLLRTADATGLGSKYSFKKGDVLFGRLRAYLRKYWLATFDGVCSTEIWPLIARDERQLFSGFLFWLVQTSEFMNAAGVSHGTHMPRSDWSVLEKLSVRLPPFPEQIAIAAVLSDMDAELSALEARRDKTRDLKQAMMQELLTGKTRLPNCETVSV
jgi:type I restriction enzyme, S subunit